MQHPRKKSWRKSPKGARRRACFLGVALALALAFVLLLPVIRQHYQADKAGTPFLYQPYATLYEGDPEQLAKITISQREGETYTLVYQNERLFLQRDAALLQVTETLAADMLRVATVIAVEDTVSEELEDIRGHLADMGLVQPEITVRVSYLDGREDVLKIGAQAPDSTHYYLQWSGSEAVYLCSRGMYEAFSYPSDLLLPVDQPVLQRSLIDRITLRIKGQEPMTLQLSADAEGVTGGMLLEPEEYPLGATAATGLVTAAANFRLGTAQGEVTAENRAAYGFDDPLAVIDVHQQAGTYGAVDGEGIYTLYEAKEETLRIVLGRQEGEYFYTCEFGGECYLVSRFLVASLLAATPETVMAQNPADMGDAALTEIRVQLGGSLLDFRQQRTERVLPNNQLDVDEKGNTLYDVSYTVNGEPITQEAYEDLVERLRGMKAAGTVPAEFSVGAATPRWQLTLTTLGGATRTITAYPLDAFYDAIAVDGKARHTLHAESLEAALGALYPAD